MRPLLSGIFNCQPASSSPSRRRSSRPWRVPGRNRYRLTGDGLRFAIFYTKLHDRLLRTLLAADRPPAPPALRKALHTIDIHITETIDQARLLPNAA